MWAGVSYVDKQFFGQKYYRCGKLDALETWSVLHAPSSTWAGKVFIIITNIIDFVTIITIITIIIITISIIIIIIITTSLS